MVYREMNVTNSITNERTAKKVHVPPTEEILHKKARPDCMSNKMWRVFAKVATPTIRTVHTIAKAPLIQTASACTGAIFCSLEHIAKSIRWVAKTAKHGELVRTLSHESHQINNTLIEASEKTREHRQSYLAHIPIVSQISSIEQKAETVVTSWGKHYLLCVFEIARKAVPLGLSAVDASAEAIENTAKKAKNNFFYAVANPKDIQESIINTAIKIEALTWKSLHYTPQVPYTSEEQLISNKQLSVLTYNEFLNLSLDEQEDIVLAVRSALKDQNLSAEKKCIYLRALAHLRTQTLTADDRSALEQLIESYNSLKPDQKAHITITEFRTLDELDKLKFLRIVRSYSPHLSLHERRVLSHYNRLRYRGDWNKLAEEEKRTLEKLIVRKFNQLNYEHKVRMIEISEEQFIEIPEEDKKLLLQIAIQKIQERGTKSEKLRFKQLQNNGTIRSLLEIRAVLRALQTYLNEDEKLWLFQSLVSPLPLISISLVNINTMIEDLDKQIDTASKHLTQETISLLQELKRKKAILEHHKATFGNLKPYQPHTDNPFDMRPKETKLDPKLAYEKISKEIVSEGTIYTAGNFLAESSKVFFSKMATGASYFFSLLHKASSPWLFKQTLNKTALALELSALVPYLKYSCASYLQRCGIPIYEIEEYTARIPNMIIDYATQSEGVVLSKIKTASQFFDDAIEKFAKLHKDLKNSELTSHVQKDLAEYKSQLSAKVEKFAETIQNLCTDIDNKGLFACKSEIEQIIANPQKLQEFAAKLNVSASHPKFLKIIEEMVTEGKIPEIPAKEICEINYFPQDICEKSENMLESISHAAILSKESANPLSEWLSNSITNALSYIHHSNVGQGLSHLGKAITTSYIGQKTQDAYTELKNTGAHVRETLFEHKQSIEQSIKNMLGTHQNMKKPVEEALNQWKDHVSLLAQTQAKLDTCLVSQAALEEFNSIWGIVIKNIAKNSSIVSTTQHAWQNMVQPIVFSALSTLESLHYVNRANAKFLEAQMDANIIQDIQIQKFLEVQGKKAKEAYDKEQKSILKQFWNVASYALPIIGWVATAGQSLVILPFIMHKIAPHMLRACANDIVPNIPNFWKNLETFSQRTLLDIGERSKEYSKYSAKVAQLGFHSLINKGHIDQERIINFENLSIDLQKHFAEIVFRFATLDSSTRKYCIEFLKDKKPFAKDHIPSLLKAMDTLNEDAYNELSTAMFSSLTENEQTKIIEIVDRYIGISDTEKATSIIVDKYHTLSSEQKAEIHHINLVEFYELSPEEQEKLLFTIVHSSAYRQYIGYFTHDSSAFSFDEFLRLQDMKAQELSKILPLANKAAQEDFVLAPHELEFMGPHKIRHMLDIIDTYHPEFIQEAKNYSSKRLNIRKLYQYLQQEPTQEIAKKEKKLLIALTASLFHKLSPSQKQEFANITIEECKHLSVQTIKELLLYLMKTSPDQEEFILRELTAVHEGNAFDAKAISTLFNSLKLKDKTEWREMLDRKNMYDQHIEHQVEQEITRLDTQLFALEKRIASLSDKDFLAIQHTIESLDESIKNAPNQKEKDKYNKLRDVEVEKKRQIASKIYHLHMLENEWKGKKKALCAVLNRPVEKKEEESNELSSFSQDTMRKCIHESFKHMLDAFKQAVHAKKTILEKQNLITEFTEVLKALRSTCRQRIREIDASIESRTNRLSKMVIEPHEAALLAQKRLELGALKKFSHPLAHINLEESIALEKEFTVFADQIMQNRKI